MAIPESFIQELVERSDIVDVVSSMSASRKEAEQYFRALPLPQRKDPFFSVSPDKQIFYCFGCGKGGSVINFIMTSKTCPIPTPSISLPGGRACRCLRTGRTRAINAASGCSL